MSKAVILLVILAGVVFGVAHLLSGKGPGELRGTPEMETPPSCPTPMKLTSSRQCQACHPGVYDEWEKSHHRLAYDNPEVQKLSLGFQGKGKDCLPCHLPRPIWETQLGNRTLERVGREEEGVDCFTCHFNPKGNVMLGRGPLGPESASAPCQPREFAGIASMKLCSPCHDQHKVHQDWSASRFAQAGAEFKDCNHCHMPRVERAATATKGAYTGRSHLFPAAHDLTMLKSSATVDVQAAAGGILLVRVENTGVGHNFPADERHRAVDLDVTVRDASERTATVRVARYRNPYREEFELLNHLPEPGAEDTRTVDVGSLGSARIHEVRVPAKFNPNRKFYYWKGSTQIPAGEARSYEIRLPAGIEQAKVRLIYRTYPYQPDEEAALLHETSVHLQQK